MTIMAVNNLVILAMGRGSEIFSANITLLEEQSWQNIALALTRGLGAATSALGPGGKGLPAILSSIGAGRLTVLSRRGTSDPTRAFRLTWAKLGFAGAFAGTRPWRSVAAALGAGGCFVTEGALAETRPGRGLPTSFGLTLWSLGWAKTAFP